MDDSPPRLVVPPALLREAAERLASVRARIEAAARRVGREPEAITLVGVAKRQPLERIVAAIEAGLRVLGENFVQEARDLRPRLEVELARRGNPTIPSLRWHMVGRLQRNKLAAAVGLFDVFESIDRLELIEPLDRHAAAAGRVLDLLVQVNVGDEPQKGGCAFAEVPALARAIAGARALRLRGLMAVPPAADDPEASRPYFRRLRQARDDWARGELPALADCPLSMGMSNDFEVAVEEGATLVRVGTALFGPRMAVTP